MTVYLSISVSRGQNPAYKPTGTLSNSRHAAAAEGVFLRHAAAAEGIFLRHAAAAEGVLVLVRYTKEAVFGQIRFLGGNNHVLV